MFLIEYFDYIFKYQSKRFFKHMIEEILLIILMDNNIMIISTNTKTSIKIFASNNRIIIKESFAVYFYLRGNILAKGLEMNSDSVHFASVFLDEPVSLSYFLNCL